MGIVINLDVMMARRKKGLKELSAEVDITMANLSILKNNKAKAIRFSTLEAICKALDCQPLKELGIISPLAELHITKAQVKALASEYGISVASRPSTPCMATRLPYGAALDYEVLRRIGEGEAYVRTMVPGNVRLRLHGDIVRLELDPEAFEVFMKGRKEIVSRLKKMGFVYITLDAEGFRSGSMDAGLNGPEVQ